MWLDNSRLRRMVGLMSPWRLAEGGGSAGFTSVWRKLVPFVTLSLVNCPRELVSYLEFEWRPRPLYHWSVWNVARILDKRKSSLNASGITGHPMVPCVTLLDWTFVSKKWTQWSVDYKPDQAGWWRQRGALERLERFFGNRLDSVN